MSNVNNIIEFRKKINMPETLPHKMAERISETIVIRTWKNAENKYKDAELFNDTENMEKYQRIMDKAEKGYKKLFGKEMPYYEKMADLESIKNFGLVGPPGYGKTASIKMGAKVAAKAMGLNFIDASGLSGEYVPDDENDFLFIPIDLAGAISPNAISGLQVIKEDEKGEKYTASAGTKAFKLARQSPASLILYDDIGNAHPRVISALLQVLHGGRYGDDSTGDGATICFATNLAGDGSDTAATAKTLGDAIYTRVRTFFVVDTPQDWARRAEKEILEGKYKSFLPEHKAVLMAFAEMVKKNPEIFYEKTPKNSGGKINSRSLDGLFSNVLRIFDHHQLNDVSKFTKEQKEMIASGEIKGPNAQLENEFQSFIGKGYSSDIVAFFSSYLTGAKPLADELFENHNKKEIYNTLNKVKEKMGHSNSQELGFGAQFMHSLNTNLGLRFQQELETHAEKIKEIQMNFDKDEAKDKLYIYLNENTEIPKLGEILSYGLSTLSPHLQGAYIKEMRDNFLKFIPKESPLAVFSSSNDNASIVMSYPLARTLIEAMVKKSKIEERDNNKPLLGVEPEEVIGFVMGDMKKNSIESSF